MKKPGRPYQRKRLLIGEKLQNSIIWRFIFIAIASFLFSDLVTIAYLKLQEILNPATQNLLYLANNVDNTLQFMRLLEVLWRPLLISAGLGLGLIFCFALLYSHRIAGPLFNLKRKLQQVEEGDLAVDMKIRKSDELHDVESAFNQMVAGLGQQIAKAKEVAASLPKPYAKKMSAVLSKIKTTK